jgi:hypothetical protein
MSTEQRYRLWEHPSGMVQLTIPDSKHDRFIAQPLRTDKTGEPAIDWIDRGIIALSHAEPQTSEPRDAERRGIADEPTPEQTDKIIDDWNKRQAAQAEPRVAATEDDAWKQPLVPISEHADLKRQLAEWGQRLKAAAEKVRYRAYLDDDVINRHPFTTVSCEALRELFAVLAAEPPAEPTQPTEEK